MMAVNSAAHKTVPEGQYTYIKIIKLMSMFYLAKPAKTGSYRLRHVTVLSS